MSARYTAIIVSSGLLLGVAADLLFLRHSLGLGMTLFCALVLATLIGLGIYWQRPPHGKNIWLGLAAFGFALALSIRNEPALVFFDFVAMAGLLFGQFCFYRGETLVRMPFLQAVWRMLTTLFSAVIAPFQACFVLFDALSNRREQGDQRQLFWPIVRGCLFAIPVLIVFVGLLSAADLVFSHYLFNLLSFQLPFDLSELVAHSVSIAFFGFICMGLLFATFGLRYEQMLADKNEQPALGITQRLYPRAGLRILGAIEALIVLGSVALLFAIFMLVQAAYLFGGLDTLELTGITYAEYARRGFFELVAVAILALGLLWLAVIITRREQAWQRRAFDLVCSAIIVLVLGMLVSVFQRMWLYEQAYGFTRLRIYTHSFMIWLALVLLLFFFVLWRNAYRSWIYGSLISALVYLALLNIASPDQLIVRANVARYQAGEELDARYLASLSSDAAPVLYELLPQLPSDDQQIIRETMSLRSYSIQLEYEEGGWRSWNWSRWRMGRYFEPVAPDLSR